MEVGKHSCQLFHQGLLAIKLYLQKKDQIKLLDLVAMISFYFAKTNSNWEN